MIKQAELHFAYQQGRHAAMVKLAGDQSILENQKALLGNIGLGTQGLTRNEGIRRDNADADIYNQMIWEGSESTDPSSQFKNYQDPYSAYNPMNYATLENMSRAGMLGGAGAGAYLGGMDPRSAAMATAGALGGGYAGGNVGQGIGEAINAFRGENNQLDRDTIKALMASGGAIGGLGGGAAAGYYG